MPDDWKGLKDKKRSSGSKGCLGKEMTLDSELNLMAGPCSVESEEQIKRLAETVKDSGAQYLRGGAFNSKSL